MVIVHLNGGLGNQMFQYALGRRITFLNNTTLKLDLTSFNSEKLRNYELMVFNINENFASFEEIDLLKYKRRSFISKLIKKITGKSVFYKEIVLSSYIREKSDFFDADILKLKDNIYIEGYWQSEKYFIDIKDIIYEDFEIKVEPDEKNKSIIDDLQNKESVSIHIRRGDYLSNVRTNQVHGVCSLEYYYNAVEYITNYVDRPNFYVFSDDPLWAKSNLKLEYPVTYIEHNGSEKSYEDLRLMTFCKHHIIANSTFSWWGAWLSRNKNKILIAPKKWFSIDSRDKKELFSEKWIRI